jgi:malate permease and related proteins
MYVIAKILPVFLIFSSGILLKKTKICSVHDSDLLLKLAFYLLVPALSFLTVSKINITQELLLFPISAIVVSLICFIFAFSSLKFFKFSRQSEGTIIIASMMMNTSFVYPFALAIHGEEGLSKVMLYDLGNSFMIFGLGYFIACRYGSKNSSVLFALKKVFISPPLWGLFLGLLCSYKKISSPEILISTLKPLAEMSVPILLLAIGIRFSPKISQFKKILIPIFSRAVLGLFLGIALTKLLNTSDLTSKIIIACTTAPAGYNTMAFSSLAKLDQDLASIIVSISLVLAMIYIPIILTW